MNREGKHYDIISETRQNPKGTNLPRAQRFSSMPFYDRATGQSVFTGPGSYKVEDASKKLAQEACPTVIVSPNRFTNSMQKPISLLEGREAGEQHYILIGDQIKYEPGWVSNKEQKHNIEALDIGACTRTLAGKTNF